MSTIIVPNSRRPVGATEVFVIADNLRRDRATEFTLPNDLAVAEVRLLFYLRDHGQFIAQRGDAEVAAGAIMDVVEGIRDLCSVAVPDNSMNNNATAAGKKNDAATSSCSSVNKRCLLTESEIIQLVDLRVVSDVDLYKVVPDIDLRLKSESKVEALLALLKQLV